VLPVPGKQELIRTGRRSTGHGIGVNLDVYTIADLEQRLSRFKGHLRCLAIVPEEVVYDTNR
jgi:hypothetical protein